jgi:phosphatidate cytidylyltransferase
MTMEPGLAALLAGVVAVLALATLAAQVLRARVAPDGRNATIENLIARIDAWWGIVAFLGFALLTGRTGVVLLFGFLAFAAFREFLTLTRSCPGDHWALVFAFFAALPAQFAFVWADWYGMAAIFIPVYVFLLMPVLSALRGGPRDFLLRVAETQWALMVCVYCVSYVPALMALSIPGFEGRGALLIAWLVLVVQGSDVLQYIWGKLAGRHRIVPALSPSKTWEGFVGGIASATLLGAALCWITPFTAVQAFAMALLVCLAGFCGGLVMSAIKRDRGVKDWGVAIHGHGGFLDRMDSVVFAAPVFFHVTRYFWSLT